MEHLGEFIIQQGFDNKKIIERSAARAIIFNDKNEVLLIYSSHYDDVSFPGGGVDPGETIEQALLRECLEEAGAVISSFKPFYKITEKRAPSNLVENVFTSYYYICESSEFIGTSLLPYEVQLGYSNVWMSLNEAINLNEKTLGKLKQNKKYIGVVERELRILKQLKIKINL